MEDLQKYRGVKGWLLVFVLGSGVLSPIFFLFTVMTSYYPFFAEGRWEALTTPTSPFYHPFWKPAVLFEMVSSFAVVAFGVYAALQLLAEERKAPTVAIAFLSANLLITIIDQILVRAIPGASAYVSAGDLIRAAVMAAIWIPYFKISKRVKATYY